MVKLFLIRYEQNGKTHWWAESVSQREAFTIARKLAISGLRPVVKRIDVYPSHSPDGKSVDLERAA